MNKIHVDFKKCVDCGACTAVCNPKALSLDPISSALIFDRQKCTGCKLCIKACPLRAIKLSAKISSAAT